MKEYLELFLSFARIGVLTFGGGYAMLPMLEKEVVEKRSWATNEEIMDYYAVGQCTPGIIAVNTATFIGRKIKGISGGIAATLGVVFPSWLIITLIAGLLTSFADNVYVAHAFAGIRVCVCVLIFNSVIKLWKSAVKDRFAVCVFGVVFALSVLFSVSPVICVLLSGTAGILYCNLGGGKHE